MVICICKRVTESQVMGEIRNGACQLEDLSERLGLGTQCGRCCGSACELLDRHGRNHDAKPLSPEIIAWA
jgi:bacterioferritin-associated ferredoxin